MTPTAQFPAAWLIIIIFLALELPFKTASAFSFQQQHTFASSWTTISLQKKNVLSGSGGIQSPQRKAKTYYLYSTAPTERTASDSSISTSSSDSVETSIITRSTTKESQSQAPLDDEEDLEGLGWQPHFANQLDQLLEQDNNDDDDDTIIPVRITEVHNQGLRIVGAGGIDELIPNIPPKQQQQQSTEEEDDLEASAVAASSRTVLVGDWILVNNEKTRRIIKILRRRSLLKRRAPGKGNGGKIQLMASNVDTVFVVSSCNQDFNVARLERYVAMVLDEAKNDVQPVIVLTKRDQWDGVDIEESMLPYYLEDAEGISQDIPVVMLDARGEEPTQKLAQWCRRGQTVAFLGSSGVGKSTLVNALCGTTVTKTGAIHEDSGQGRHTTTRRQLHYLPNGCAIMDTPGLRELQLIQASHGLNTVFADLVEIAKGCGFRDCTHRGEPNCAIQEAIDRDEIDPDRVERWIKLVEEDALNLKTMMEFQRRNKGDESALLSSKKKKKRPPPSSKNKKKNPISKEQQKKNKQYRKRLAR